MSPIAISSSNSKASKKLSHQQDLAEERDAGRVEALAQAGDERALALLGKRWFSLRVVVVVVARRRCCCCR